ncbi:hypothetical protein [Rugosimonospora africana]|uniref:Uncharacterized protein n=1 Tax=Rugosimonospora africana TaxID=556532 RepID=A0A8J3VRQ0_9ACTN|nr:hypothetical protein [Rugosimonospora africana]GIH16344.1 hypothetical protein Raf01_45160 [Rugosimonospora africana]
MSRATPSNPSRPRDHLHTFIVTLPSAVAPSLLAALATARLRRGGYRPRGPVPVFPTSTRRSGRLIDRWRGYTSGGPIGLLDLDGMRRAAVIAATHTWHRWSYVVAGTPAAKPFWHFADRYGGDRYPLARARRDYLSQPRISAIRAFNAAPYNPGHLPVDHLEALQVGLSTYVTIAELSAVVGDGVVTAEGYFFVPESGRVEDQLTFLHHANRYLAGLPRETPIAAIAVGDNLRPARKR